MTSDAARRHIALEGGRNFRDIGGYETSDGRRVRWGRVYRSAALWELSDADVERLSGLDIGLVIDLRTADERTARPSRLPETNPPDHVHLPIRPRVTSRLEEHLRDGRIWDLVEAEDADNLDTREAMRNINRSYALDHTAEYGTMLRHLAAADARPSVIHCAAGKDRTGFAVALILMVLGVPHTQVVDDYTMSDRHILQPIEAARDAPIPRVVREAIEAHPDHIVAAIGAVEAAHGSVDRFVRKALGIEDAVVETLRARLLT